MWHALTYAQLSHEIHQTRSGKWTTKNWEISKTKKNWHRLKHPIRCRYYHMQHHSICNIKYRIMINFSSFCVVLHACLFHILFFQYTNTNSRWWCCSLVDVTDCQLVHRYAVRHCAIVPDASSFAVRYFVSFVHSTGHMEWWNGSYKKDSRHSKSKKRKKERTCNVYHRMAPGRPPSVVAIKKRRRKEGSVRRNVFSLKKG